MLDSTLVSRRRCGCCCIAHCSVSFHNYSGTKKFLATVDSNLALPLDGSGLECSRRDEEEFGEYGTLEEDEALGEHDEIASMILSLNLNLD